MSERILVHEVTLDGYKATADSKTLDFGTWGSYGIEKLHLTLGKAWEGLVITAHFNVKGEVVANTLADVDNMMDVPWEATKENTFAGRIVFEGNMNGLRRMTANLNFKVTNHADYEASDPVPTDDKWNQFVTETKGYREDALAAANRALQSEQTSENAKQEVVNLGNEKQQEIRDLSDGEKQAISELTDTKLKALQDESTAQQAAITKKGSDTLATIPEEYTQLNNDVSQLKADLDTLAENDFMAILDSKLDVIKGKFEKGSIDKNGQNIYSNDLMRSIDYIKIYPGIPYQFKTINGNGLAIYVYKSDGSVRSEYMAATTTERTRTITFNSDDEKIRVVINAYNEDYTTYPVFADNFESIIANVSKYIAKDYNYGSIYNGTINIDTVNKTVNTSGASILTDYGVFIKIPAGEVSIDYEVAVYIGVNKYDSDHNLIVKTLNSSMASDFIRIFVYHRGRVWFADKINRITIDGKNYNENVKTICCIGDSFTASNISWHTFIGQNLGYDMVNLGVSGTRMTVTYTSGGTNYECFIDRVANGALNSYSPDLIVLFGGINDTVKLHNNQMHIGTIEDEAEYSASTTSGYSFIGRVKYLVNLIKEKKPSAQILGVIPPNYSEGTSGYEWWEEYIAQIQEALRKVYEYYGIPYVDLKKRCQEMYENAYNLSTYRINGRSNMHPSVNGYKAIAKCVQKDGIENMFVN